MWQEPFPGSCFFMGGSAGADTIGSADDEKTANNLQGKR